MMRGYFVGSFVNKTVGVDGATWPNASIRTTSQPRHGQGGRSLK